MAGCVLPADHVQHRDSDGDTWPVDPTGRPEWFHVPRGTEVLSYDPAVRYALTVERDLPGFIVASGSTVRVLHDSGSVEAMGGAMGEVERAVLVARLRAWADAIDRLPL